MKLHSIAVNDKKTGQEGDDIKREGLGGGGHLNYSNNRRSYVGETGILVAVPPPERAGESGPG